MAGNYSNLVTNALMKKVLSDVAHLDSTKLGKNYTLTNISHHVCTSGPATWYGRAGLHLTFWNGALPFTPGNKNYKKGKRSATVADMKASLSKAGFQMVWAGTGQQANSQLAASGILRPGDIATMLSADSAHAAMWTGADWRSDFLQGNKPYPYSSVGRGGNETFILWRHPSFLDSGNVGTNLSSKARTVKWRSELPTKTNKWGVPTDKNYINDNAMAFVNFLVNKGLSADVALGVAGNIMSESGFNPYNYIDNDNNTNIPSGGIAMWHGDRLTALKEFAKKRGKSWQDIQTQADFLWYELSEGNYKNVLAELKKAKTMEDASFIWGDKFEVFAGHSDRSGERHELRRLNAQDFKTEYTNRGFTPMYALQSSSQLNSIDLDVLDLYNSLHGQSESSNTQKPNNFADLNAVPINIDVDPTKFFNSSSSVKIQDSTPELGNSRVKPTGQIGVLSVALDYKKIADEVYKNNSENLLTSTYKELSLRKGGKIEKYQEGRKFLLRVWARLGHPEDYDYEDDIYARKEDVRLNKSGLTKPKREKVRDLSMYPDYYWDDEDEYLSEEDFNRKYNINLNNQRYDWNNDPIYNTPNEPRRLDYEVVEIDQLIKKPKLAQANPIEKEEVLETVEPVVLEPREEPKEEPKVEPKEEPKKKPTIVINDYRTGIEPEKQLPVIEEQLTEEPTLVEESLETNDQQTVKSGEVEYKGKMPQANTPNVNIKPVDKVDIPERTITPGNIDYEDEIIKNPDPTIKVEPVQPVNIPTQPNLTEYDPKQIIEYTNNLVNWAKDILNKYEEKTNLEELVEELVEENDLDYINGDIGGKDYKTHMVAEGEDVLDVAEKYGVPYLNIIDANNLKSTDLTPGQVLRIYNNSNKEPDEPVQEETQTVNTDLDLNNSEVLENNQVILDNKQFEVTPPVEENIPTNITKNSVKVNNSEYVYLNPEDGNWQVLDLKPGLIGVLTTEALDKMYGSSLSLINSLDNLNPFDKYIIKKLLDVYNSQSINPRQFDNRLLNIIKNFKDDSENDFSFFNKYILLRDSYDMNENFLASKLDEYRDALVGGGYDPLTAALIISELPYNNNDFVLFLYEQPIEPTLRREVINLLDSLSMEYINGKKHLFERSFDKSSSIVNKLGLGLYLGEGKDRKFVISKNATEEQLASRWLYYKPIIDKAFEGKNLPEIFKYIPFVSDLNPLFENDGSRGTDPGNAGLWLIGIKEAKGEGLTVNSLVDQRRNPEISSKVVANYLGKLYNIFKNDMATMAALLIGPNLVTKAIAKAYKVVGSENIPFSAIKKYLPDKVVNQLYRISNYYNKFKNIKYNYDLNVYGDKVTINQRVNLEQIAKVLNIPIEELKAYNPDYREYIIQGDVDVQTIVLPKGYAQQFYSNIDNILNYNKSYYAPREVANPKDKAPESFYGRNRDLKKIVEKTFSNNKKLRSRNRKNNRRRS